MLQEEGLMKGYLQRRLTRVRVLWQRRQSPPSAKIGGLLMIIALFWLGQRALVQRPVMIQKCQYDDNDFIQLIILNQRPVEKARAPLIGLVHSLLAHTSRPIRFTIATNLPKEQHFLYQLLHGKSPAIQVSIQSTDRLGKMAQELVDRVQFKTWHHAGIIPIQKLFFPLLEYPKGTQKVLMVDEDFVFYQDIAPLWDLIMQNPTKLDLYCPIDPILVEDFFTKFNRSDNGHAERYCNSGLMGLPISPSTTEIFAQNAASMTAQYPGVVYRVTEQDIVNRVVGPHGNVSRVQFLPCGWGCDAVACRKSPSESTVMRGECPTCPGLPLRQACHAFHFVNGAYQKTLTGGLHRPQDMWKHYGEQSTTKLLHEVFEPRVAKTNCPRRLR